MQLAETLKSPIVHALGGKEHVEYDNPYDVGMTGFIGFSSGYAAMHACDALVMLGTDFPYKQFFPTDCQVAQIDIRPENLGRRCKIDLGLVGDVKLTIEALLPLLKAKTQRKHLDDAVTHIMETMTRGKSELLTLEMFTAWVQEGLKLTPKQRRQFASKAPHTTIMVRFLRAIEEKLSSPEESSDSDSIDAQLNRAIRQLFLEYDADGSGASKSAPRCRRLLPCPACTYTPIT